MRNMHRCNDGNDEHTANVKSCIDESRRLTVRPLPRLHKREILHHFVLDYLAIAT